MFAANTIAAIIAFVAFGANFLGMALLLLFNPRSRAIRWLGIFTIVQLLWLLLQGLLLIYDLPDVWWRIYAITVHFMPGFFFAAMLMQRFAERRWLPLAPVAAAVAVLPLFMPNPLMSPLAPVWHGVMWGTPALLYTSPRWQSRHARGARRLGIALGVIVPVAVLAAILFAGNFVLFGLPLMTIVIQLMLFYGIVFHRYYDIEIRAARSGDLAASAAAHDRLALLGELSATIAHEVRNPLTGIRSLTQMIAESPLDDERRRRYTGVILDEITRLDRIVGNLTDLARRSAAGGAATAAATPIKPLFEDLAMLVEPRARRSDVTLNCTPNDVVVHAPREALAQALLNLLLNAVSHSPAHGTVRLSAVRANGKVTLSVRDEGPGVPAAERARIFEPFQSKGGTGLGLAVVRRLADEHGWHIDVKDAVTGGAEFRITLPETNAHPRPTPEVQPDVPPPPPPPPPPPQPAV